MRFVQALGGCFIALACIPSTTALALNCKGQENRIMACGADPHEARFDSIAAVARSNAQIQSAYDCVNSRIIKDLTNPWYDRAFEIARVANAVRDCRLVHYLRDYLPSKKVEYVVEFACLEGIGLLNTYISVQLFPLLVTCMDVHLPPGWKFSPRIKR